VPTATQGTPAPTSTPAPQATVVAPTPTTTAVPQFVPTQEPQRSGESDAIFGDLPLLEKKAFGYLSELTEDVGVRTSGTDLERAAADFLVARLEGLSYRPEVQEFAWESPVARLRVGGTDPGNLDANILTGTADGEVTGMLVAVGLAKPEDVPADGLEGAIALIERGEITFSSKVARVNDAGAVAAIIYNNEQGNFRGTLRGRSQIPAISLSRADGQTLMDSIDQGEPVEATVAVQDNAVPSRNVIAELPGAGDGVIVVGAHYDTVPDSVGASDNSSGVAALLAVAERLRGRSFPFTVRFVAFGSEETGLHGSEHYVDSLSPEELENIRLMINLDSIGSGDRLVVAGDRWVIQHVNEVATRQGIALGVSARGTSGSDHANFREAWVPVIFFRSDDLSRINSPADTMEHINPRLLGDATALTLDLLVNAHTLTGYGR
jgi:aminopeptidase YwaD